MLDKIALTSCLLLLSVGVSVSALNYVKYEKLVEDFVLTNYSTTFRPTLSNAEPVVVSFDLKLKKLVKMSIREQVLHVNVFIMMRWNDPQLKWNKKDFNNTEYIVIPSKYIWTPDVLLYNTAEDDPKGHSDLYKTRLTLRNDGVVIWTAPVTFKVSCSINVKWFPFDKQTCQLKFGSWSYSDKKLNLKFWSKPSGVDSLKSDKIHITSGHWDLKSLTAAESKEQYGCCPEPFSQITYTLVLKRIPSYYLLYLVLPCLFLCILTIGQFFIPPEVGERIGFGITTVLAMSVYLLVISDKLPEKSDQTPLLGLLYVILFFLMVFELMGCVITTYLAFKTTPPPTWLLEKLVKKGKIIPIAFKTASIKKKGSIALQDIKTNGIDNAAHVEREFSIDSQRLRRTFSSSASVDDMVMKYQLLWGEIAHHLDKIFFYVFITLTLLSPALVIGIYEATD